MRKARASHGAILLAIVAALPCSLACSSSHAQSWASRNRQLGRELDKTGDLNGWVVDVDTSRPLEHAYVMIIDRKGRILRLHANDAGRFRFENILPGKATITASAPGYLQAVTEIEIQPLAELRASFPLRTQAH